MKTTLQIRRGRLSLEVASASNRGDNLGVPVVPVVRKDARSSVPVYYTGTAGTPPSTEPVMAFLYVKDWKAHQHYSKRNPPWIKFYAHLLDDDAFLDLPVECKAMLPMLWLIASRHEGKVPTDNPDRLAFRMGMESPLNLQPLIDAGFLTTNDPASIVLASGASVSRAEERQRRAEHKEGLKGMEPLAGRLTQFLDPNLRREA